MNGNASAMCLSDPNGLDLLVWQIGALIFPVFGLSGHLILIITLLNSTRRHSQPTSLYFIFISISESIYLIFLFWDWLYVTNLAPDPRRILNCAFFYPFVSGTGYISLLLLVQLNLDRLTIIRYPQQTYLYITHKRISWKIIFTFSTIFFFVFHYYFSVHYDSQSFIVFGQSCRVHQRAYLWFYSIWPYLQLFARLMPCSVLIYCTIYIFSNRSNRSLERRRSWSRQRELTYSLVLLLLSIYTFIAVIPISLIQILNQYMWKHQLHCICSDCPERSGEAKQWKLFNVICIMWETSIYVMKFYIKFAFSADFRFEIKRWIFFRAMN